MAITSAEIVGRHPAPHFEVPGFPAKLREVAVLDVLAFAVVSVALATPFFVLLLWGQIEKA